MMNSTMLITLPQLSQVSRSPPIRNLRLLLCVMLIRPGESTNRARSILFFTPPISPPVEVVFSFDDRHLENPQVVFSQELLAS